MGLIPSKATALVFAFLIVTAAPFAQAGGRCESVFKNTAEMRRALQTSIRQWGDNQVGTQAVLTEIRQQALNKYNNLPDSVKAIITEESVLLVLLDTELPLFHKRLEVVFDEIQSAIDSSTAPTPNISRIVSTVLRAQLHNRVPASSITARIQGSSSSFASKKSLIDAVGFMTLEQSRELLYGKNPSRPSAESLLGQYLKATGAKKVMRTFPKTTNVDGPQGEPRLAVAISNSSFVKYKELFIDPHFLIHTHSPSQGTLYVAHNGMVGDYGNLDSEIREMGVGSILPHILLSSSEANRTANFFALQGNDGAQTPWELNNGRNKPYCARGGYRSCTHWIGNLPIGDRLVDSYSFPGRVDEYADDDVPRGVQRAPLRAHNHESPLVQEVWSAPGNEQLAMVLGVRGANSRGELANPGWVAHGLTGQVSAARVPVVFAWVTDHTRELSPRFDLQIRAY